MSNPPVPFPAFLDLRRRLVVIVGTGPAAEKRAQSLAKYGADLVVIGPDPSETLIDAEGQGLLTLERRPFAAGDLEGAFAVICADEAEDVRRSVIAEAAQRGCLVSVAGDASSSNFSMPSTIRRGPLQIAISTTGQAPEVARQVKSLLQGALGEEWSQYVSLMTGVRASLSQKLPSAQVREAMESIAASDVLDRIRRGQTPDVEALVTEFSAAGPDAASAEEEAGA